MASALRPPDTPSISGTSGSLRCSHQQPGNCLAELTPEEPCKIILICTPGPSGRLSLFALTAVCGEECEGEKLVHFHFKHDSNLHC